MKSYKIVDRKAPRFRRAKYRYNLINRELWQNFKSDTAIDVSWEDFKRINEYINLEIRDTALNSRDGIHLPKQMGHLWLGLFPPKERIWNEPHMRNTGQHATFFSFETSGMQGKIVWEFNKGVKYKVRNYPFWGFLAHRDFKTKASHKFKESPETYMRINLMTRNEEYLKKLKIENECNSQRDFIASEDPSQIC